MEEIEDLKELDVIIFHHIHREAGGRCGSNKCQLGCYTGSGRPIVPSHKTTICLSDKVPIGMASMKGSWGCLPLCVLGAT